MTYDELAARIAEMTPAERAKPVMGFDDEYGEFTEFTLVKADEICDPAPEDQWVLDYAEHDFDGDDDEDFEEM